MRLPRILPVLGIGALVLASCATGAATKTPSATPKVTTSSTCASTDSTASIQALGNALSGKTLPLAAKCYEVNGTITISNTTGLTINGNGAFLQQTTAPTSPHPILKLVHDTNLTIENLTLDGAKTSTTGGVKDESDFGVVLEGDTNVKVAGVTVENTLGDWAYLSPPLDIKGSNALNTGIDFVGDHFLNAGYHGFTVESVGCPTSASCDGLTVSNSTMTNMAVDAMDFEYDLYPTAFKNGLPQQAAEDFITIESNTWTNWTDDWYASVQDHNGPGVQEQHVSLIDNTLNSNAPLFEVDGTPTYSTTPPYLNAYLTVTGNAFGAGFHATGYRGGSTPVGSIHSVAGIVMEHNTFPVCQTAKYCGSNPHVFTPNQYELDIYDTSFSVIEKNSFLGAVGVVQPQTYAESDTHLLLCMNAFGAGGSTVDAAACLY